MTLHPLPFGENEYLDSVAMDALRSHGIEPVLISEDSDDYSFSLDRRPAVALIVIEGFSRKGLGICLKNCLEIKLPTIALVPPRHVESVTVISNLDDFLICPPNVAELIARCKKVLRHTGSQKIEGSIIVGGLVINPVNYAISLHGIPINLRFKEYELLLLLAKSPGRVYTREAILNHVWGYDYLGGTRTVDVHIRRLRSKIEGSGDKFIETVWNLGYRFKEFHNTT